MESTEIAKIVFYLTAFNIVILIAFFFYLKDRIDTVRNDIVKYPSLYLEGTRFEEWLDRKNEDFERVFKYPSLELHDSLFEKWVDNKIRDVNDSKAEIRELAHALGYYWRGSGWDKIAKAEDAVSKKKV